MRCPIKPLINGYGHCERTGAGDYLPVANPAIVEPVAEVPPSPGAEIVLAMQGVAIGFLSL